MILFYNVVYVCVCKIGEEKFGGCWWSFSWIGQSHPVAWHPRYVCVCDFPNESWTTVSVLINSMGNKRQLTDTAFHCTVATSA